MFRIFAIAVFALFTNLAVAADPDPYFILGAGQARLKTVGGDDLWYQNGFDHVSAEDSPTYRIGIGLKFNRYLSMELDYRNLGQFNSHALFVSDIQGAPGNYNTQTKQCNGPCDATSSGWQHGTTDGVGLSLVAAPDWTVAPFIRLGAFYHRSSFTSTQVWGGVDPFTHQLRQFDHDCCNQFHENKVGAMLGAGLRFSYLDLEYTYYPKVGGPVSPYLDISTVTLSVRIPL